MPNRRKTSRGYSERKVGNRKVKERFLIVCEGEETEPNYFKCFRVPKDVKMYIKGIGKSPSQIIEYAKQYSEDDEYDQIWCVFDRDDWKENEFNKALKDAKTQGFKVAYSNEAFELWYLLHFQYIDTAIPRSEYKDKLTQKLGKEYAKNSQNMYELLKDKQEAAIKNSEQLLNSYKPENPAKDNPSTTVHLLVKELNKFIS
jgi:RloB-like protein